MKKQYKLDEILKVSLHVFSKYGYKKTTVEDIAKEMGMTKGALYVYVKDKEELYHKAVASALLNWQDCVKKTVEREADAAVQFTVMCRTAFHYLSEDNDLRRILMKDPSIFPIFSKQDRYSEINSNSVNLLKTIIEKGIAENKFRDIPISSITKILFTMYKMLIVEAYIVEDDETPEKTFDDLMNLITCGLFTQENV
jgi:AcrR family transcriptional regulator